MTEQSAKKNKLRTAAEVVNRLKWSYNEDDANQENTVIGYDCRINGPLEKSVQDYTNISDGGDIPEHRIQYFRRKDVTPLSKSFLWDRASRLDKLFGSGEGSTTPLSAITLDNARQAERTMKRLAEERAIRAEEKAKRRARQQAAKALANKKLNASMSSAQSTDQQVATDALPTRSNERHSWVPLGQFYSYDTSSSQWQGQPIQTNTVDFSRRSSDKNLKFVTWNVLFDLQRNENNELVCGDNSLLGEEDTTTARWTRLIEILSEEGADVIALQEVSPRFLELLLACGWVREQYSSSASPSEAQILQPYGNLTLWRRCSSLSTMGLYLCRDVYRNRATIVSLCHPRAGILNIANVHLPADQHSSDGITRDRTAARRKELGAVIAKLQVMEQQFFATNQSPGAVVPIILGDFNSGDDDPDLFQTSAFVDCWKHWYNASGENTKENGGDHGLTFDWKLNKRAEKTVRFGHSQRPPRRIDRVFVGKCVSEGDFVIEPSVARVLGRRPNEDFPPSDHYGVSASFALAETIAAISSTKILYDAGSNDTWAMTAYPNTNSLLALLLSPQVDDGASSDVQGTELSDATSSLPIPHVTLLNGFVDLTCDETARLATQAVGTAVRQALHDTRGDPAKMWSLPINNSSLDIFEHRASATVVCVPDTANPGGAWLNRLYETLRAMFPQCHDQESRFGSGWTPHFSLASFPDAPTARSAIDEMRKEGRWVRETEPRQFLQAYGVGLFRRDIDDGKFHPVATVPLGERRRTDIPVADTKGFLLDAGLAWSATMMGASSVVLQELERACGYTNKKLNGGRLQATVSVYGSHAIGVSLPGISDLDTAVVLSPKTSDDEATLRSTSDSQFLNCVAERLSALHKAAKTRTRLSTSSNGTALMLLTVKLSPQSPGLDVMLCRTDAAGAPINSVGEAAIDAIRDSDFIRSSVRGLQLCDSVSLCDWHVFQGALRIIKLWAFRRQIYGKPMGYIGGGGWATLLLWVLQQTESFKIQTDSLSAASQELASHFYQNVFKLHVNSNKVVTVSDSANEAVIKRAADLASGRNSLSVLGPVSGGDFGSSTTTATTAAIWDEVHAARISRDFEALLSAPFDTASFPFVLALQADVLEGAKPTEIRAWGATRALNLTVELGPVLSVRLASQVLRKENSFWYFWGVSDNTSTLLNEIVSKQTMVLEEECNLSCLPTAARLVALTGDEYMLRFGS